MDSEEFRETFLRSDSGGPTKAKMAGKKEAKQKAGPSGQKEKNRKETESPTRAKNIAEDAGRRPAQDMQRREAHKDLKDRGELKKPSMTKRRCAAKAFYSCPAIISHRPESQKTPKEPQENPEEESRII